jgi:hypothetical protein
LARRGGVLITCGFGLADEFLDTTEASDEKNREEEVDVGVVEDIDGRRGRWILGDCDENEKAGSTKAEEGGVIG